MKSLVRISLIVTIPLLFSCSSQNVNIKDQTGTYLPSQHVRILNTKPVEAFTVIGQIDVDGDKGTPVFDLIQQMREKAMEMGADAIIPINDSPESILQEKSFNPWINFDKKRTEGDSRVYVSGFAIKFSG